MLEVMHYGDKCRFGRHDWDVRENPETRATYEVCVRCNAYRDDGQPAVPYAGSASAALANIGGLGS